MFLSIIYNKPSDLIFAYNICIMKLVINFLNIRLQIIKKQNQELGILYNKEQFQKNQDYQYHK